MSRNSEPQARGRRGRFRLLLCLAGLMSLIGLAGCGSGGGEAGASAPVASVQAPGAPPGLPPSTRFPQAPRVASRAAASDVGTTTVDLHGGWNALGLQCAQITSLGSSPSIAGFAYFDGTAYQTRAFTQEELNASGGGRRGLWVFANAATSFSYAGQDDANGKKILLQAGWNLISTAQPQAVNGSELVATADGETVPLGAVVLTTATRINGDNSYSLVNLGEGGSLEPGRPYWIYAAVPVTLSWTSPEPSPLSSPSPSPSPEPSVEPSPSPPGGGGGGGGPIFIPPAASPSPSGSPAGSPSPSPGGSPAASPSPSPGATPSPSPSPVMGLSITTVPTSVTAGSTFDVQVTVLDGASVPVDLSASGPAGTTLGGYGGPVTASGGVATFTGLTLNKAGVVTLSASSAGYTGDSKDITVGSASASKLVLAPGSPATVTAGINFDLTFYGVDSNDNLDSSFAGSVSLGLDPGFGGQPSGQVLTGAGSRTAAGGQVTFSNLSLSKTAQAGLLAQCTGLTSLSPALSVDPGAASALGFAQSPPNGTAGRDLDGTVVEVLDALGNRVTTQPATAVTLSIESGTAGAVLTPPSPANTTLVSPDPQAGSTRYSGLRIDRAGTYRLRATAPGGLTGVSGSFTVAAATGDHLSIRTLPTTLQAAVDSPVDVVVEVRDSLGQIVVDDSSTLVALSHSDYQAAPGAATATVKLGAFTTQIQARASSGVATFSVQKLRPNLTGTYDIQATAGGLLSDARGGIVVTPGPATQLLFSVQPSGTAAGQLAFITPTVEVIARDGANNLKTDATGTVDLALSAGMVTLAGNTGAAFDQGRATFPQLRALSLGLGNRLRASASALGLNSADSQAFDVRMEQLRSGNVALSQQAVSADGRYVAFSTSANLVPEDTNGSYDVYRLDRQSSVIELASRQSNGQAAGLYYSEFYSLSANGNQISYQSTLAAHLIDPGFTAGSYDTLGQNDVFVRNMTTGQTVLESYDLNNVMVGGWCYQNSVNDSGECAFLSSMQLHGPSVTYTGGGYYAWRRTATALDCASRIANTAYSCPSDSISINNSGQVAFATSYNASIFDSTIGSDLGYYNIILFRAPGDHRCVSRSGGAGSASANGNCYRPVLARQAPDIVAFYSYAINLGTITDPNGSSYDVFRGDGLGAPTLVSAKQGQPAVSGNSEAILPSISDDGQFVAFRSYASDLVSGDGNGTQDIFVRDVTNQSTQRVSTTAAGGDPNSSSDYAAISGDGAYVVFRTNATNLAGGLGPGLYGVLRP